MTAASASMAAASSTGRAWSSRSTPAATPCCRALLSAAQCEDIAALYPRETGYRSRVVMARHGFGRGEYKYFFAYPPPAAARRTAPCAVPAARAPSPTAGTGGWA